MDVFVVWIQNSAGLRTASALTLLLLVIDMVIPPCVQNLLTVQPKQQ